LVVLAVNLLVLIAILALLELYLLARFRAGDPPAGIFARTFLEYELSYRWRIVQLLPECARFDPALGYTLKPPGCRFENREFSTELRVNSAGFRDDEASLAAPEVVVLGDSYAMGWGVDQHESFPEVLASTLGRTVLNAGISSYGTVRELAALARVDRSRLKVVVIQYNDNDFRENRAFLDAGGRLAVMSEAQYRRRSEEHRRELRGHRFGLLVYEAQKLVVNQAIRALKGKQRREAAEATARHAAQAAAFLEVVQRSPVDLSAVSIVVLELSDRGRNDTLFARALCDALAGPGSRPAPRAVKVVDLAGVVGPEMAYTWDPHLRREGHRAVAERLAPIVGDALEGTASAGSGPDRNGCRSG
jgi:lysophospholipase L1-like esterase